MFFAMDAHGYCIHVCPEWLPLTGQKVSDALGMGWLDRIHADDRETVMETVSAATRAGVEFSVQCRLLKPDGTPRWIGNGGVPSFGMRDGGFIGYLGMMTELTGGASDATRACGSVGRFVPPAPHPGLTPDDGLDRIADHLIRAHALIEDSEAEGALPGVRLALAELGFILAARALKRGRPLN